MQTTMMACDCIDYIDFRKTKQILSPYTGLKKVRNIIDSIIFIQSAPSAGAPSTWHFRLIGSRRRTIVLGRDQHRVSYIAHSSRKNLQGTVCGCWGPSLMTKKDPDAFVITQKPSVLTAAACSNDLFQLLALSWSQFDTTWAKFPTLLSK